MNGVGIRRYKPSGLRDWKKILVGIAGLKNSIGDLLCSLQSAFCADRHGYRSFRRRYRLVLSRKSV